jgi:hemolysin D
MLALMDVGMRYGSVAAYHWRRRQPELAYSASEAEFLPASLELIERPVSPTARLSGTLLVLLLSLVILWSAVARVDIIVPANGKVIPSGRTKTIASVEVASVRNIYVTEGQSVKAGDVLLELDARAFEADQRKAEADANAARLEMARSKALVTGIDTNHAPILEPVAAVPAEDYREAKTQLSGQYRDYLAKRTELDGQINRYLLALPLARERASSYQELARTHDVSANSSSEKMQAAIDLDGQLAQARNERASLIAETRRRALDSLTDAAKTLASATQDAARAMSQTRLLTLRAPVDGSVQQLTVHTIGGVVPAAQPLMLIVPKEDQIEVEAWVINRDIGFVFEGQSAEVKVDAFDYTKHGMIHGQVTLVSKDAVDDEKRGPLYKARITLGSRSILIDGRPQVLTPGMSVNVEIKTGTRRIIEYVLSPLIRHAHESLNER